MERGELRITLPLLICVSAALSNERDGYRVSLSDLVGESPAPVTEQWSLPVDELARLISGDFDSMKPGNLSPEKPADAFMEELLALGLQTLEPPADMRTGYNYPPPAPPEVTYGRPTLSEERAAKRLGVDARTVREWAHATWGRSLDEEASARAKSPTPQARGHATRQLVIEIERQLDGPPAHTP